VRAGFSRASRPEDSSELRHRNTDAPKLRVQPRLSRAQVGCLVPVTNPALCAAYHAPSGLLHFTTCYSQGVALGWNMAPFLFPPGVGFCVCVRPQLASGRLSRYWPPGCWPCAGISASFTAQSDSMGITNFPRAGPKNLNLHARALPLQERVPYRIGD